MDFHDDPTYYKNIAVPKVRVTMTKRGDYENFSITIENDDPKTKNRMLYMTNPPMKFIMTRLTMEGNLGETIGTTLIDDRTKALFSAGIVPGGLDDEVKAIYPDLEQEGFDYFGVNHQIEVQIVDQLYDIKGSTSVNALRTLSLAAAKHDRLLVTNAGNSAKGLPKLTLMQLNAKMESDPEEREIVMELDKEKFHESACLSPDPANYDSDGKLIEGRAGKKSLSIWPSRKVYPRTKESIEKNDTPPKTMTPNSQLASTIANWGQISEHMKRWYVYNATVFKNPSGSVIKRGIFKYTDEGGNAQVVQDPMFSPLKKNLNSLCYTAVRYGITFNKENTKVYVKPLLTSKITVVRQTLNKEREAVKFDMRMATGLYKGDVPDDEEEVGDKRSRADADAEPASKRQNTGFEPDQYDE